MICAVSFIPSGSCRRDPLRYELSPEEAEALRLAAEAKEEFADDSRAEALETVENEGEENEEIEEDDAEGIDHDTSELPPELRMDEYDDQDETMLGAAFTGDNIEDPLVGDDDEGSDQEENRIESGDMLIISARTDDDQSLLELNCYDPENGNMWVHHDIALAAFPLAISFMDCAPRTIDPGSAGAFVAVGTFKPGIEIWNLDVIDALEPSAVLGGEIDGGMSAANDGPQQQPSSGGKKRKKKGKKKKAPSAPVMVPDSHTDAVLALDWNRHQRQMLASASADTTVKMWDVTSQQCFHTCRHHGVDKVAAVRWHSTEASVLATGAYDKSVAVLDVRSCEKVTRFAMTADLEDIAWDPHNPALLVAAAEDGMVRCFDVRNTAQPLWSLQAHREEAASTVCFAPHIPGLVATASTDKTVKLWRTTGEGAVPTLVSSKEMAVGKLFSMGWSTEASQPWTLACGGSKGQLAIWEADEQAGLAESFQQS